MWDVAVVVDHPLGILITPPASLDKQERYTIMYRLRGKNGITMKIENREAVHVASQVLTDAIFLRR